MATASLAEFLNMPLNEAQEEFPVPPPSMVMDAQLRAMFSEEEVPDEVVRFLKRITSLPRGGLAFTQKRVRS